MKLFDTTPYVASGSIGSPPTVTSEMRPPGSAVGSKAKVMPATCGKRPAPSSICPTPCSSDATMSAPVSSNVASVFWKGSTVSTSPIVTSPASMEARRPPPFWMATSMP